MSTVHRTLASLPWEFGFVAEAWLDAVDFMLEKGKGPKLGKLRTLKLLEAGFNFGCKCMWARRLAPFIEKHGLYNESQHGCRKDHWMHTPAQQDANM